MVDKIARAKRKDNGKLIEGDLKIKVILNKAKYIICGIEVEPPIDYFSGKFDKNDKKMFSSDIVLYNGEIYEITHDENENCFLIGKIKGRKIELEFYSKNDIKEMEVIGNMYENAE